MSKKITVLFSLIVLLALTLNACGAAATPAPTEAPTQVPTQVPTATEAPTAAPTAEPTVTYSPDVKAVITITLPKGATWSDGTALTSKDVVGTWNILWMRSEERRVGKECRSRWS